MIIGIDIRNIGKGRTGDEVVFFNLVKNLSKIDTKNEYRLFTDRSPQYDRKLEDEIKKLELRTNFKVVNLGKSGINKFIWNFWTFPRFIRQNPVDVYLTQYIVPFFVPKNIKIATIVHDVSFKVFPSLIRPLDRLFLSIFIPLSLRRADRIIGVSRFTKEEIEKYYEVPKEKLDWVHNAVSEDILGKDFSPEEEKRVKEKYGLPENFILYLGTMQPRKNIPLLIRAFSDISELFPEVKLVLAGGRGHNFDHEIDETIERLDLEKKVILTGFVPEEDKAGLFHLAKIFCFPSLYEGFGIPILEAFAMEISVIASRIPPHMEISGNSALLFNPKNQTALSKNIRRVLEDHNEAQELRLRGKKQLENFSWEKTARRFMDIFKSLKENH